MPSTLFAPTRSPLSILSSVTSQLNSLKSLITSRTFKPLRQPTKLHKDEVLKAIDDSLMPPYPYGPRQTFHQADGGLYGGAQLQFGNKISKGRNKGKTRRRWYPNVRLETLRSEALDMDLTIRVTASCMRTITKCGGLDQYLLGDKPARIKELGLFGWRLRWKIMNTEKMKQKFALERKKLGLGTSTGEGQSFEEAYEDEEVREELLKELRKEWQALHDKDERFIEHVRSRWEPKDKKEWVEKIINIVPPVFGKTNFTDNASDQAV